MFVITKSEELSLEDQFTILGYTDSQDKATAIVQKVKDQIEKINQEIKKRNHWVLKVFASMESSSNISFGRGRTFFATKQEWLNSIASVIDLPEPYKTEFIETINDGGAITLERENKDWYSYESVANLTNIEIKRPPIEKFVFQRKEKQHGTS